MISVLLYSPQCILAAGFRQVIESDSELRLAGVCTDVDSAIAVARSGGIDVLVMDVNPDLGIGRLMEVRQHVPDCKVVLWAYQVSLELAHQAREIGVRGILRKDLSIELTLRCLRKVAEGEAWYERTLLNSLLQARSVRLSPRERQLIVLVSQGLSNKHIAATLFIAETTIKVYLSKLFRKLGVNDRFELALYGLRNVIDVSTGEVTANGMSRRKKSCPRSVIVPRTNSDSNHENEDFLETL